MLTCFSVSLFKSTTPLRLLYLIRDPVAPPTPSNWSTAIDDRCCLTLTDDEGAELLSCLATPTLLRETSVSSNEGGLSVEKT